MPTMSVNLRGIDRALIQRAKLRAAQLGITLKAWITRLIVQALDRDPLTSRDTLPAGTVPPPESPVPPKGDS